MFADINTFRLWWRHSKLHCSITWFKLNSHQKSQTFTMQHSNVKCLHFCSYWFYQRLTWDMLVYFIWLFLLNNHDNCAICLKKCSDVRRYNVNFCDELGLNPKLPHLASSNWIRVLRHWQFPYKVNTRRAAELIFDVNSALNVAKMLSPPLVMTSSQHEGVNTFHPVAKCLKIAWTKTQCLICLVVFLLYQIQKLPPPGF